MNKEPEKTLDDVMTLYLSETNTIDKSVLLDMFDAFDGVGLLSFLIEQHGIKTTRHEINELIFKKVNGSREFYRLMFDRIEPVKWPKISSKIENALEKLLIKITEDYCLDSLESAYNLLYANWIYASNSDPLSCVNSDIIDDEKNITIVYGVLTKRRKMRKTNA
jgi:hypothetical protein